MHLGPKGRARRRVIFLPHLLSIVDSDLSKKQIKSD
jgi:hypothetical protein